MGTLVITNKSGYYVNIYTMDPVWGLFWTKQKRLSSSRVRSENIHRITAPKHGFLCKFVDDLGREIILGHDKKLYKGPVVIDPTGLLNGRGDSRMPNWNRPMTFDEKMKIADLVIRAAALAKK